MIKTTIVTALLLAGLAGGAQAGEHRYSQADRAFYGYYERPPVPGEAQTQAPRESYQQRFGAFSAANTARNLGF